MKQQKRSQNPKSFFSRMLSRSHKKRDTESLSPISALVSEELISKACWESLIDIDFETFLEPIDPPLHPTSDNL